MEIKEIYYSSHFAKSFKRLPLNIKKQALKKEAIFKKDCFNQSLKTHKLKGELNSYWAFSINNSYRILFEFTKDNKIGFIDIGTHSIYK